MSTSETKKRAEERMRKVGEMVKKTGLSKEKIDQIVTTGRSVAENKKVKTPTLTDLDHIVKLFETTEEQLNEIRELKATITQQAAIITDLNRRLAAIQSILQEKPQLIEEVAA